MRVCSWWGLLLMSGVSLSAGAASPGLDEGAGAEGLVPRVFIEDVSYFQTDEEFHAWLELRRKLKQDFDDICGDTFCEGDYANIESIIFRCSVDQSSGRIGQCYWVFGGSYEAVDPATGKLAVESRTWACRSPLARGTTIQALMKALEGPNPMNTPLPKTRKTLYDGLIDCL